jgi:hypothetical protein
MLGSMATLPVPDDLEPRAGAIAADADPDVTFAEDPLHTDLLARDRIQVPVFPWPQKRSLGHARRWLRISAQRYNDLDDYQALADGLIRRASAKAAQRMPNRK